MGKEEETIKISADPDSTKGFLAAIVTTTKEEKIIIGSQDNILGAIGSLRFTEGLLTTCGMTVKSAVIIDGVARIIVSTLQNNPSGIFGEAIEAGAGFILAGRSLHHEVQRQRLISRIKNKLSGKIRSGLMENLDQ